MDDFAKWEAVEEATELLVERQYERALEHLKRVIESDHTNHYAFQYTAAAMHELGELTQAVVAYRTAIRLAPKFLAARLGLSHTLRRLGDHDGALAEVRAALARFPEDGDAHHAAALACIAKGLDRDAAMHLQQFLASAPELEAQFEAQALLDVLNEKD